MNKKIAIVSPVYNDWDSYFQLVNEIKNCHSGLDVMIDMFAIDDGSDEVRDVPEGGHFSEGNITRLEVLHLIHNMGHQRAIAIGLSEVFQREHYDAVVVMDADGEDRPEDVFKLIQAFLEDPNRIVVAQRTKRSEGWLFRRLYALYKLLFRGLVGTRVDFGNFCILPSFALERLAFDSNTWNHLAAAIIRSNLPFRRIQTERGVRYSDRTKMSLEPYVIHGLSAMSVFSDRVFVRIMIVFALLAFLAFCGIIAVIWIRLFTDLAIPGWATSTVGILLLIAFQALLFLGIASFTLLYQRTSPSLIPARDAPKYIRSRKILFSNDGA
ncbi:MAG: hypothetical protein AMJ88_11405 [Anaerolineae bacterium SM23_ 63]|nr:MAG: hypothetical protein AMJ88_11405 [Anaerolineae bacterium SM23_ 63]HEY45489.1 glycosyltransferase [Anaerolineae bacterium]